MYFDGIRELHLLLPLNHWTKCLAVSAVHPQLDPSKMPEWLYLKFIWGLPKWQEETPKKQYRRVLIAFGALPPMLLGCHWGEPFESEYFLNYGDFSGNLRACYGPRCPDHGGWPPPLPNLTIPPLLNSEEPSLLIMHNVADPPSQWGTLLAHCQQCPQALWACLQCPAAPSLT